MPNFDGTIDNRWRPDLESSQRRVREEESGPVRSAAVRDRGPEKFEAHDAQTRALIRRAVALERLPHGEEIGRLLDEWHWADRMKSPEEKQRMLEPHIAAVRRDPRGSEPQIVFLMLAFEPVRRAVSRAFIDAQSGLGSRVQDMNWSNRSEARMLDHIDRQALFDVTREAALEAVFRYPSPPPKKFFPWLRETIAYRALDQLAGDLPQPETAGRNQVEAAAVQEALAGFERADRPSANDRAGLGAWRARIRMRDVFDLVEDFFQHEPVRDACQAAVGRLPRGQREVLASYFFEEEAVADIADRRGVTPSTVYNQKSQGQARLHDDDRFFVALVQLRRVRDRARVDDMRAKYPDGRWPDGRRIVVIDEAA